MRPPPVQGHHLPYNLNWLFCWLIFPNEFLNRDCIISHLFIGLHWSVPTLDYTPLVIVVQLFVAMVMPRVEQRWLWLVSPFWNGSLNSGVQA